MMQPAGLGHYQLVNLELEDEDELQILWPTFKSLTKVAENGKKFFDYGKEVYDKKDDIKKLAVDSKKLADEVTDLKKKAPKAMILLI